MTDKRHLALTFAANLQRLMDHRGLSQNELAKLAGVGQRTLSTLLDRNRPLEMNPRSTTIDQIAAYFEVPAWQMLIPNLPIELLTSPRLAELVDNYRAATPSWRENLDRIASSAVTFDAAALKVS